VDERPRAVGHGDEDAVISHHLDHAHCEVLARHVGAKTNEIPVFTVLLDRMDISDAVISADAMHAQRGHAGYLARRGAHYLFTVKRNQPGLHARLAALPWRQIPVASKTREQGHGRAERRTLKVTAAAAGLAFPHAAQALQIVRRRRLRGKKWSAETCYAITSLTATQASPARLAAIIRGHWAIEDRLHWVRDMDFDEDRSQVRTASGPRISGQPAQLAITILPGGAACHAAALRHARPAGHYGRSRTANRLAGPGSAARWLCRAGMASRVTRLAVERPAMPAHPVSSAQHRLDRPGRAFRSGR
jgi:predicted transposase YbfD/YdcC